MWVDEHWTCYRRNYITIQTHYVLKPTLPGACLYVEMKDGRADRQVQALGVSLSASMDDPAGKTIGLIQHTAKRDRGPQMDVGIRKLSPSLPGSNFPPYHGSTATNGPYLPFQAEGEQHNSSMTPSGSHTFERIQFKQATANNGRRRAQQQFYHIMVELHADIRKSEKDQPQWVRVAQKVSEAMVVRGRSPGHYKDNPNSSGAPSGNSGGGGGGSYGYGGFRGTLSSYAPLSSQSRSGMGGGGGAYRGNQVLPAPHLSSILTPSSHSYCLPPRKYHEMPTLPVMGDYNTQQSYTDDNHRYYSSTYESGIRGPAPSYVKNETLQSPAGSIGGSCGQEEPSVDSTITPIWTMMTANRIHDVKGYSDMSATY